MFATRLPFQILSDARRQPTSRRLRADPLLSLKSWMGASGRRFLPAFRDLLVSPPITSVVKRPAKLVFRAPPAKSSAPQGKLRRVFDDLHLSFRRIARRRSFLVARVLSQFLTFRHQIGNFRQPFFDVSLRPTSTLTGIAKPAQTGLACQLQVVVGETTIGLCRQFNTTELNFSRRLRHFLAARPSGKHNFVRRGIDQRRPGAPVAGYNLHDIFRQTGFLKDLSDL